MAKYAANTTVPVEKSLQEIQSLVNSHGAKGFGFMEIDNEFQVVFALNERNLKFSVRTMDWDDYTAIKANTHKVINQYRATPLKDAQIKLNFRKLKQSYMRSLLLIIRAKFEAIESNIYTFDEAFMSEVVTPDGRTVGEILRDQIPQMYRDKQMPPLLMMGG